MIYKASQKDAADVAKLAVMMWQEHTIEELTEEFAAIIGVEDSAVFVLEMDGQKAGFAQCQLRHDYVEGTDSSPVGYLEGIYIRPEYRRKGYAKELLADCEEWAEKKGCSEFASDCELDNDVSLQFHMAMGFEEANRIICFRKIIVRSV